MRCCGAEHLADEAVEMTPDPPRVISSSLQLDW
jgi:hypothetical protein